MGYLKDGWDTLRMDGKPYLKNGWDTLIRDGKLSIQTNKSRGGNWREKGCFRSELEGERDCGRRVRYLRIGYILDTIIRDGRRIGYFSEILEIN